MRVQFHPTSIDTCPVNSFSYMMCFISIIWSSIFHTFKRNFKQICIRNETLKLFSTFKNMLISTHFIYNFPNHIKITNNYYWNINWINSLILCPKLLSIIIIGAIYKENMSVQTRMMRRDSLNKIRLTCKDKNINAPP